MSKIRILPDHLANQIAAGEVVERPASVIKEMVENSLDAEATRIEVEIEGGGVRLMRITDNGCGMDEDDLLMSLERHGTSKIHDEEDLGAINTLGFRGEALPSIGSVAKLTMSSRVAGAELGTKVVYEYGTLLKVHETGCAPGTSIEVRSLFGRTPARRKFLRTTRTERGHIEEVIRNYALGCPAIGFILRVDGRELLHLDEGMNSRDRLAKILHYDGDFIEVQKIAGRGEELERRADGWLTQPDVNAGPAKLRLFVNGRAVHDRMMIHAVNEGLRGFLMKGKNPSGLIMLTVNPSEVDVNVHPAKHEVRFRNANDVHAFLETSVREAMAGHQRHLQARIFNRPETETSEETFSPPPLSVPEREFPLPQDISPRTAAIPFQQAISEHWSEIHPTTSKAKVKITSVLEPERQAETPPHSPTKPVPERLPEEPMPHTGAAGDPVTFTHPAEFISPGPAASSPAHNLRIIGVFGDLYILCEGSAGMVVIDQHAAHERLLYEKLHKQYLGGQVTSQALLFPETVELSHFQSNLVEKNMEELERMGFALRDFGGSTFVVSAVPALGGNTSARELLLDTLEQFGSEEGNRSAKGGDLLDHILATMACRAAVKAHTALSNLEIEGLLNEMAAADLFSHCPHGRPVVHIFSRNDIKNWFHRT
ncbi:DNA mismatch repair endonuclease MutL [Desulforhopalus vacuolatus]|uniref:DNA mismatch repair endonuclease MutL n=1 Tax=Desulforhopalus vacuolatus TaxID=40414 RepID=UPI001962DCBE|nr:DNA mismatch repair endonuclease MutL [Desulforhopalus vacuolatus]MBM9521033.1 DNA mismatch repair endonuclease MutL [Desulforhopalus vacuolatus]